MRRAVVARYWLDWKPQSNQRAFPFSALSRQKSETVPALAIRPPRVRPKNGKAHAFSVDLVGGLSGQSVQAMSPIVGLRSVRAVSKRCCPASKLAGAFQVLLLSPFPNWGKPGCAREDGYAGRGGLPNPLHLRSGQAAGQSRPRCILHSPRLNATSL